MNILIIDDDSAILEALTIIIDNLGYKPITYKNALKIKAKIDKTKPDLIFFDILLSGAESIGTIKRLKASPKYNKIPIILISANNKIADYLAKSKADDYLAKPFGIDQFQKIVEKWKKIRQL